LVEGKTEVEEQEAYRIDLVLNICDSALESLLALPSSAEKKNLVAKYLPLV